MRRVKDVRRAKRPSLETLLDDKMVSNNPFTRMDQNDCSFSVSKPLPTGNQNVVRPATNPRSLETNASTNPGHMRFVLTSTSNQPRLIESEIPRYQLSTSTSNWLTSMESKEPRYKQPTSTSNWPTSMESKLPRYTDSTSTSNQPRLMESKIPRYKQPTSTSNWPTSMESKLPRFTDSTSTSNQLRSFESKKPRYKQAKSSSATTQCMAQLSYLPTNLGSQVSSNCSGISMVQSPSTHARTNVEPVMPKEQNDTFLISPLYENIPPHVALEIQDPQRQQYRPTPSPRSHWEEQKIQIKVGPLVKSERAVHDDQSLTGKLPIPSSELLNWNSKMAGKRRSNEKSRDPKGPNVNHPVWISPIEKTPHLGVKMSCVQPPKTSPQRPPRNKQKPRKDDKQQPSKCKTPAPMRETLPISTSKPLNWNSNMVGKRTNEKSRDPKGPNVNHPGRISPTEKLAHLSMEMSRVQPPKTSPQRPPRKKQKPRKDEKQHPSKCKTPTPMRETTPKHNEVKRQAGQFQYAELKEESSKAKEATKLSTLNIVIFGLHEKSGAEMFQKLFRCNEREIVKRVGTRGIPYQERKFTFKSKEVSVFVSPLQYADYSLRSAVNDVHRLYKTVRCFVVVFDANFVRFSSDVKRAMADLEKKYFRPNIWKNAVLIILNSDDVIGEGTVETYLNRQGNENLKYYVDRMGGRVIALPTYEEDYYDPTRERLMEVILKLHEDYQVHVPQTLWGKFLKVSRPLLR